ncbi:MAG: xanthine phosphoribosyltransferase [Christensenellales bacterium]|jgi:xanthine phosphoribosyltransferase|uniref:Xanthine phosphoribosyltransferase n=1 Tax=Candidatus Avichristensenella intestinipullorum TaxID=2840693 RepID=A0A9D0YWZ3_9FIRM|nr:xanthine phosphoribosyltransferase [Christensenellales bacterium]HIQ63400.1 xanthine phosphoribosyltransferase [Candidatus Avichristensenella intestinipullorum]
MKLLTERIARDGQALDRDILLVDSFLNHQVDMQLMRQIGDAFAAHFRALGVTRVLTIESSGIAPAGMTALALDVPLVVMKKRTSRITAGTVYQTNVRSFTKNTEYALTVSQKFLFPGERVLFIDDFLAMGEAALGAARLIEEAGSVLCGIGIVIEKTFQPGRKKLEDAGYDVFSLARIRQMDTGRIEFLA